MHKKQNISHFLPFDFTVRGLGVGRGERVLQSDLCFGLKGGECLLVEGANGVGKTSLLRILAGLLAPIKGDVLLANEHGQGVDIRAMMAWLGHENAMKNSLSVLQNLMFYEELMGHDGSGIADALKAYDVMSLKDLPFGFLSAGQKRRVALCRVYLADKPLWLLDEPTVSLDKEGVLLFENQLELHHARGGASIVVSHLPIKLTHAKSLVLEKCA